MDNVNMNSSQGHERAFCCAVAQADGKGLNSEGVHASSGKYFLGVAGLIVAW